MAPMESVVQEALKYTEMEREYRNDKGENTAGNDFDDFSLPRIKIVGCGVAVMLIGEAKSQDKSESVVKNALSHPLLDVDCRGATGALVHITGGPDLILSDATNIAESLTYEMDSKANVIWGARVQKDHEGKVRVMAIMTGVHSPQIMGKGEKASAPTDDNSASAGRLNRRDGSKMSESFIDIIK